MVINLDFLNLNTEVKLGNVDVSELEKNKVYTLVGHDGLYRVKHNGVIKTVSKICDVSKAVLDKNYHVEEGFELLVPKIPFKYYLMCLNYFRDIHTQDRTEAGIIFYRVNENTDMNVLQPYIDEGSLIIDDGLIVYCPLQINSGGLHEIRGETMYEYLRLNSDPYVEVHSHHTIGCSWSGVDNENMCHYQLFTVFRHIYRFEDTLTRYRFDSKFFDIQTHEIFELPFITKDGKDISKVLGISELKTKHAEFYPEEWLNRSFVRGKYSRDFLNYLNENGFNFQADDRIAEIDRFENEVGFENYAKRNEFKSVSKEDSNSFVEDTYDSDDLFNDGFNSNNYGYGYDYNDSESDLYLNSEQLFEQDNDYYGDKDINELNEDEDSFENINNYIGNVLNKDNVKESNTDNSDVSIDEDESVIEDANVLSQSEKHIISKYNDVEDEDIKKEVQDDTELTVKDVLELKGVDWDTLKDKVSQDNEESELSNEKEVINLDLNEEDGTSVEVEDNKNESSNNESSNNNSNKDVDVDKKVVENNNSFEKEDGSVSVLGAILSSLFKNK